MENEEQTSSESNQPQPRSSSTRLVVMGVLLVAMGVMALFGSESREGMREKYTAQFKEALSEEQFGAYKKARNQRGRGRGGGGGALPRPDDSSEPGKKPAFTPIKLSVCHSGCLDYRLDF